MSDKSDDIAVFTIQEKQGLANDLHTLANMIMEHGQYLFNLIAAVNVQHDTLISAKIISEEDLSAKIEAEILKMKEDFVKGQKEV